MTSSNPKALFPKGPSFSLDDFSTNEFIVRDFIDGLADSALSAGRRAGGGAGPVATSLSGSGVLSAAGAAPGSTAASAGGGQQQPAFDPKPLIRTFENALAQLATLSEELGERESELVSQVRRAEMQHDQTLDTLGRKLDQSMAQFEALDLSLNSSNGSDSRDNGGNSNSNYAAYNNPNNPNATTKSGGGGGFTTYNPYDRKRDGGDANRPDASGNVAVQIGEKLEELDRQRRRALDAAFLIQCWTEVSETGSLASLQDVQRQGGPEAKVRCAVMARHLTRISQRLDPASWGDGPRRSGSATRSGGDRGGGGDGGGGATNSPNRRHNTREAIEKFCETLEQDLLKQFNSSYRRQNLDDMLECARVLGDFNGGASVIAAFVNQHQFFIERDNLVMNDEPTADTAEAWDQIADPDAEPAGVEPSLQSLVDEVRIVMQEESFIIRRAFPFYERVLVKFVQRVFQQSIQQRLEAVLDRAAAISSLAFLRSLHSSRAYVGALVEDLKAHGLTEHPDPCSAQVAQTLDQQVEELFVPYLVGASYVDRERRSLEELYNSLLFRFTIYHSRRKKAPTGFMASLAQQGSQLLASAKDAYLDRLESADLTPTQKAMMLRIAGLQSHHEASAAAGGSSSNSRNEIEASVSDQDGVLRVPNARRMLTWLAESVRRTLELGAPADTAKDVSALLNLLLTSMGRVYIETALDAAADQAAALESSRTEPDLGYLTATLRPAVAITTLMDRFIATVLIRLAESNATVRRAMEAQKRAAVDAIEKKANSLIRSSVGVAANWVAKCLGTQKKTDFRPREDHDLESLQTPTCLAICTFLARAAAAAAAALDGQNLVHFSTELAVAVLRLLFDHLKRFPVNATGGLMVTQDIAKYTGTLRAWPLAKELDGSVELLTEIGSLFIVGPEALREKARALAAAAAAAGGDGGGGGGGGGGWRKEERSIPQRRLAKADFKAFVQRRDDSGTAGIQSVLAGL